MRERSSFLSRLRLFLLLALVPATAMAGPPAESGRIKVLLGWIDGRSAPVTLTAASLGGERVADYGGSRLITLPREAAGRLPERLRGTGLTFTLHDDFDVLSLPGGRVDTRRVLDPALLSRELLTGPPRGTTSLYVVQLVGPPLPAWLERMAAEGAKVIGYVPQNGYLLGATAGAAAAVGRLPFVQWTSVYHSFLKARPAGREAEEARSRDIEIAALDGAGEVLAAVQRLDPDAEVLAEYDNRTLVRARIAAAEVDFLLADGRVIGIFDTPGMRLSDERQVMAATSNVDVTTNRPTNPTTYQSWLEGLCPFCADLAADDFSVSVADTGLDNGREERIPHPDLAIPADRVRYSARYPPTPTDNEDDGQDVKGHGTMVAAVIAGDASTGARDKQADGSPGFLLGMGIAPSAGIYSTKITDDNAIPIPGQSILGWASDATDKNVWIQNHSHNDTDTLDGQYTANSRLYDIAVRDSDGTSSNGDLTSITLTVSSGNVAHLQDHRTMSPATAKNVIAVGGAENYRDSAEENFLCPHGHFAGGFRNIMSHSRHGTRVSNLAPDGQAYSWSTYIKPDLTAVATSIVSAQSTALGLQSWCRTELYGQPYLVGSGTSFSAPVAAGAALIASRVYSEFASPGDPDPALASPALLKAILIGTARSMEGGTDRCIVHPGATIGPRPNDVQGFGMIDISGIVDPALTKSYVNQAYTFTSSAEANWNAIYYRRDPAKPVRVALTWTDAPAESQAAEPLVNDLDLYVNAPFSYRAATPFPCFRTYWGNNTAPFDQTWLSDCTQAPRPYMGHDFRNNTELVLVGGGASESMYNVTIKQEKIAKQAKPDSST
ncbi:MAG: S8 family serine peptidase, partial [Thermoanaerobaculia bacterium]